MENIQTWLRRCVRSSPQSDHGRAPAAGFAGGVGEVRHELRAGQNGMDRLALAIFVTHGLETDNWPMAIRDVLGL